MKIVLTVELQQDTGTPVLTGTQTKTAFTGGDVDLARTFLVGPPMAHLIKLMGWVSDGQVALTGTPTLTISQL